MINHYGAKMPPVSRDEPAPARVITISNEFFDRQAEFDNALAHLDGTAPVQAEASRGHRIDECMAAAKSMLNIVEVGNDPKDQASIVAGLIRRLDALYVETRVGSDRRNLEEVYRQCTRMLARPVDKNVEFQPVSTHHTR
jgi:hypothetical protein